MYQARHRFSFTSMALPGDTFAVISFTGHTALSTLFDYDITLASKQKDLDLTDILSNPATFTMRPKAGLLPVTGILRSFKQMQSMGEYAFFQARLVPKLWRLTLLHCNQIFLDKTLPEIITEVLEQGGLSPLDYQLRLEKDYPRGEFVCQYNETLFDFLSRRLEHAGLYYFFDCDKDATRLVITDTLDAHTDIPQAKEVTYAPPSGLDRGGKQKFVYSLAVEQSQAPAMVKVRDYHSQTPSLNIQAQRQISQDTQGETYLYGEGALTPGEADHLAIIRAQEQQCGLTVFHGESTVPQLRPGFLTTLKGHYRDDCNQTMLVTRCSHHGAQAEYLVEGLRNVISALDNTMDYHNTFTAIPADVQYRPPRATPKPRIHGTLNAFIDAAGSGQYAELDDQGRYKVILPFDLSGRKDGRASCWLRMVQPYTGATHGMHFPLHKGAEVLLTFIEGDPDRPVIAGAVPNPEHPSQVTSRDQTMCKITTGGGNLLHMQDKAGAENILLKSPVGNTFMGMGAMPESDDDGGDKDGWKKPKHDKGGFRWSTEGEWNSKIHQKMSVEVGGNSTTIVMGGDETIVLGFDNWTVGGLKTEIVVGYYLSTHVSGTLEVHTGVRAEFDASEHCHMRASSFETAEDKVDIVGLDTKVSELLTTVAQNAYDINQNAGLITEFGTALAMAEDSITDVSTQLQQELNAIRLRAVNLTEENLNLINQKLNITEEDFNIGIDALFVHDANIFL
jgi:type VI secretion system secreted protein VgrG